MPNDVPDWTAQTKANLVGGISNLNLGDVGAPSLQIDSATEAISTPASGSSGGVIASFKAAAGSVIAQVGAQGPVTVGTTGSVSPTFGQAPAAGNGLVARVTASASGNEPTTGAAGWVKVVSVNTNGGWCAEWVKPNAAGGDAAPTFTSGGSPSSLMVAQLSEWSGMATASPGDQSGSASTSGTSLAIAAGAADVAFGDLVCMVAKWAWSGSPTPTFIDTFNNGGAAVDDGQGQDAANFRVTHLAHAIIPAATVAQPLGVAPWGYDASGANQPASGTIASVVLAATPGKTYTAALIAGGVVQGAATSDALVLQLLDGVTVLFLHLLGVTTTGGSASNAIISDAAFKGTKGNSMTLNYTATVAGIFQSVAIGAYLR